MVDTEKLINVLQELEFEDPCNFDEFVGRVQYVRHANLETVLAALAYQIGHCARRNGLNDRALLNDALEGSLLGPASARSDVFANA